MDQCNDLENLINNYTQLYCQKGKEHNSQLLNIVCCDSSCNPTQQQFEALCCICQEDKCHSVRNHKTKPLKRMLKMVIDQIENNRNDIRRIEAVKQVAKDYKLVSEKCEQISQNINSIVDQLIQNINQQYSKASNIIRNIVVSEDQQKLNNNLSDLRQLLTISKDNMFIQFKNYEENSEKLNRYSITLNHTLELVEKHFNAAEKNSINLDTKLFLIDDEQNERQRLINLPNGFINMMNRDRGNQSSTEINLEKSQNRQRLTPQLLKNLPLDNNYKCKQQPASSTYNFLGSQEVYTSQEQV